MYAYLKKEDLINGLKSFEMKFEDFEDDMKADPEVVEAVIESLKKKFLHNY